MLYGIDANTHNKTYIQKAIKEGGHYICPICEEALIIKNGSIRKAHFAHKSSRQCDDWYSVDNSMSEWHRNWQEKYAEEYREVPVEINGVKHIADIQFGNYVIEFQHSPMSKEVFMERTFFYTQKYKLIWVFDFINISNYDNEDYYNYEEGKNTPPIANLYGEYNEYKWKNQKHTFEDFAPNEWEGKVYLVFDLYSRKYGHMLKQVTWCIEEYDFGILNYKRFATKDFKIPCPQKHLPLTFKMIIDIPCTYAGEIETITAKNGNTYTVRKCAFSNGLQDIRGVCLFADKEGRLPELKVGDTYRVQMIRYYDRKSETVKEFVKVIEKTPIHSTFPRINSNETVE